MLFGTRDSRVSNFDASGNGENGIMIESGSHNQLTGFAANSNGGDGVLLFDSAHSQLSGFTANSNAGQGVNVGVVAMHNQPTAFAANSNTGDGVFLSDKADSNEISGFITDSNGLSGVDIMRFIGIVSCSGPKRIPCLVSKKRNLVENGDAEDNSVYGIDVVNTRTEEIIGNTATSNGTDDLLVFDRKLSVRRQQVGAKYLRHREPALHPLTPAITNASGHDVLLSHRRQSLVCRRKPLQDDPNSSTARELDRRR